MCCPLFLLLLPLVGLAQSSDFRYDVPLQRAHEALLQLRLDEACRQLAGLRAQQPSNGMVLWLENYADVAVLLTREEHHEYERRKPHEAARLKALAQLDARSPYYLFTQAEVKLQWAIVHYRFGENWAAARGIWQAWQWLKENDRKFPDFALHQKSLGVLHVLLGSIPEKYDWMMALLGLRGDVQEGMARLVRAAETTGPTQTEAAFLRALLQHYVLRQDQAALQALDSLRQRHPDNELIDFFYLNSLLKSSQNEKALALYRPERFDSTYLPLPFYPYLRGEMLLYRGDYDAAATQLAQFVGSYTGHNHLKDGYYKLFLAYWLSHQETAAQAALAHIKNMGTTLTDADRYALRFAEDQPLPHRALLRARLFSDGGYYEEAQATLRTKRADDFKNLRDQTEFYYRQGRIYQLQGKSAEALQLYAQTIRTGGEHPWYYAPNAALQSGYLLLARGELEGAQQSFRQALSFPDHPYKDSIDNKARAALQQLRHR